MAVPTTVQQMALTRDTFAGGFMERVQATLAFVASGVLAEPQATPYHQGRAVYAQTVIRDPRAATTAGGPIIVMNVNVVSTTTYDEAAKVATCTIADIDLEASVRSLWNALGGIDTAA